MVEQTLILDDDEQKVVIFNVNDAAIAELQELCKDVDASADYPGAKAAARTCQKMRGALEDERKEQKADALAWGQKVDGRARELKEKIVAVEDPIKAAIKKIDDAEAEKESARITAIQTRIALIRGFGENLTEETLDGLKELQGKVVEIELNSSFEELLVEAEGAKAEVESKLRIAINNAEKRAEEEAEIEATRKAQEEQQAALDAQQAAMDKQAAELAEAAAVRDAAEKADREAKEAEERADREEQDRIRQKELDDAAKELRIKQEAVEAEELRQAEEREAKEAEEKAEADRLVALSQAPDKEKLIALAVTLSAIEMPAMESDKGKQCLYRTNDDLNILIDCLNRDIGEMS